MNIKRTLNYLGFFMKAKGRHGTHSPFVYAFVENVMRASTVFKLPNVSGEPVSLRQSTINRLGRAIQYFNPEIVYADRRLMPLMRTLKTASPLLNFEIASFPGADYKNGGLIFCSCSDENKELLKALDSRQCHTVIMTEIHCDASSFSIWQEISKEPVFKMVLDVWDFGILSNHPDFKIKQHFRLR